MDGFARRKEQSKEDIRRAAWELFGQFGVEKVSVADIARRAGVSQATIYNNFGSKDTLVREFVTSVIDQLVDRVQEVLAVDRPYWARMEAVVQIISEMMAQGGGGEQNLVLASSADLLNDPEIAKIRVAAEDRMVSLLLGLVREGREQGLVHGDMSEAALRIYFLAFMRIFVDPQVHRYYRDPRVIRDLGSLMIHGLSSRPTT